MRFFFTMVLLLVTSVAANATSTSDIISNGNLFAANAVALDTDNHGIMRALMTVQTFSRDNIDGGYRLSFWDSSENVTSVDLVGKDATLFESYFGSYVCDDAKMGKIDPGCAGFKKANSILELKCKSKKSKNDPACVEFAKIRKRVKESPF